MRGFRSMWGVGLCLALTGCAVTERRVVLGPGVGRPGAKSLAVAHSHPHVPCGCGMVQPPSPPSMPQVPSMTLARFFPLERELNGAAGPLEAVRPDPLGVRTIEYGVLVPSDRQMVRTSDERQESDLPLGVNDVTRSDSARPAPAPAPVMTGDVVEPAPPAPEGGPGVMPAEIDEPSADAPMPSQPPEQALPQPVAAIPLEQVEDPSLAGRPRLAQDGTLIPRPRLAGDPSYGPDPTFPASYAADGSAPTSVPRNREVWPTRRPWRPTLFSRMLQRFRKDDGAR